MKTKKFIYTSAVIYILWLIFTPTAVRAYSGELKVFENVNTRAAAAQIALSLEDFEYPAHSFYPGNMSSKLISVGASAAAPLMPEGFAMAGELNGDTTETENSSASKVSLSGEAFSGSGFLRITAGEVKTLRIASYNPDTLLDLTEYGSLFFAIRLPEVRSGQFDLNISILSGGEQFAASAAVAGGGWHAVFLDISGFDGRTNFMGLTIEVGAGSAAGLSDGYAVDIDSVGLCSSRTAYRALRFLTDDYYANGARMTAEDDYLELNVTGTEPSIESYSLNPGVLDKANAIQVKYYTTAQIGTIKLYYTTALNPSFSEQRMFSAPAQSGVNDAVYFPAVAAEQIKIVFDGTPGSTIRIYSIAPASSYVRTISGGSLSGCIVADNLREIVVSGKLTAETASRLKGVRLSLYELDITRDFNSITEAGLTEIAQIRADEDFRFRIPLYEGSSYRLCSAFVVGAEIGGTVVVFSDPIYITNPEILAKSSWSYPDIKIKKGMETLPTEAQSLGIKNTVLRARLEKLVTTDESQIKYDIDGVQYYFSRTEVRKLDTAIKAYSDADINVSLLFTVSQSGNASLDRLLLHPLGDKNAGYCAFNTGTADGVRYLRAAASFLAHRYSGTENGRVTGYIIGYEVSGGKNYSVGSGLTVAEFAESYSKALRVIYNSTRAAAGNVAVYISLANGWDTELPSIEIEGSGNRQFVDTLAAKIAAEGDIPWSVVYNPNPRPNTLYSAYLDDAIETQDLNFASDWNTSQITAKNIEILCRYFTQFQLSHGGGSKIMLLDLSEYTVGSAMEETYQAADYAYTYFKINTRECALIESYIIAQRDDYDSIIKYIDSDRAVEKTAFAPPLYGALSWSEIIPGFAEGFAERRTVQSALIIRTKPAFSGSYPLWNFSAGGSNWYAADNCAEVTIGHELYGRSGLLMAKLNTASSGEYSAVANTFEYALDLSESPYLTFDVQLAMLRQGISSIELRVLLYSGDSVFEAEGVITQGYWNTVVIDASPFTGLKRADRIKIWFRGIDGADIGEPTVIISEITALSMTRDDDSLSAYFTAQRDRYLAASKGSIDMRLVWILVAVIAVALLIILIRRFIGRKPDRRDNNVDLEILLRRK